MRTRAFVCPNPECHENIKEPILLNDLSKTPTEHYYACPHCLIKLKADTWARAYEKYIDETVEECPQDSVLGRDAANARVRDALDILAPNRRFRHP